MREGPERIWIEDERPFGGDCHVCDEPSEAVEQYSVAYVRADIHQAALTHVEAAERERDAAVAATLEMVAYEVAEAEEHDAAQSDWRDGEWLAKRIASGIRARATDVQRDALAAMLAEAREEGRREAQAENARLREALTDALDAWDTHNASGDGMQGYWEADARAALTGEGGE